MKNFTLGLNIVFAIAVAVLFYLHFASPSANNTSVSTGTKPVPAVISRSLILKRILSRTISVILKRSMQNWMQKTRPIKSILGDMKSVFASKYQELQKIGKPYTGRKAKQQELM
jgi:hypothetical protein